MIRRNQMEIHSTIAFLREFNHTIHTHYPGVLCIAKETEGYPNVNRAMNFDLKWNFGSSNDARNFLRTPYAKRSAHYGNRKCDMFSIVHDGVEMK